MSLINVYAKVPLNVLKQLSSDFLKIREDYYLELLRLISPGDFNDVGSIHQAYQIIFQKGYDKAMQYAVKYENQKLIERVYYKKNLLYTLIDDLKTKEIHRIESPLLIALRNRVQVIKKLET